MPALNFMAQFASKVESGEKRHTIRDYRKDGRDPKVGQILYLYTGMRTKACRKLKETICIATTPIVIGCDKIVLGLRLLTELEAHQLAIADGFYSHKEFQDFFEKHHGLLFHGLLIEW